jgi:F0F1-type ATP synthase assembly protein I
MEYAATFATNESEIESHFSSGILVNFMIAELIEYYINLLRIYLIIF